MAKSISKQEFRRLMYCGHGRCFAAMEQDDPAKYREIILYGCLHDLSYDMQCEGSRGIYMYNLTQYFSDADFFAKAAAEKFRSLSLGADAWLIQHFCDFLTEFAVDGNADARSALEEKYAQLYAALAHTRRSRKRDCLMDSYTYLCITLMQLCGMERFLQIAGDIGRCFPADAYHELAWFLHCAKDEFGEEVLLRALQSAGDLPEIARFLEILTYEHPQRSRSHMEPLSAEEIIQLAQTEQLRPVHRRRFTLADNAEKRKLAEYAVSEQNPEIRARIWRMFDTSRNPFPLSPDPLLRDAASAHEPLQQAAIHALCQLQGESIRLFAKELLQKHPLHPDGIRMLLGNYQSGDSKQLQEILCSLRIDRKEQSGWHGIVTAILDHADSLPDAALLFIYEKSLCSCCRESALEMMAQRGMITSGIARECACDCNPEIRSRFGCTQAL